MVSLSIPSLQELKQLASELSQRNIPHKLFYEPDIDAHTAICTTDAAAPLVAGLSLALKKNKKQLSLAGR